MQYRLLSKKLFGTEEILNYANFTSKDLYEKLKEMNLEFLIATYDEILMESEPLYKLGIPIILTSEDTNKRFSNDYFKRMVFRNKPDRILVQNKCSEPAFDLYFGEKRKYIWFPWGVDTSIFKDYKEPKIYDITISGKFTSYLMRRDIHFLLQENRNLNYKLLRSTDETQMVPAEEFYKEINRSKISLGGCIQKNFMYKNIYINSHFKKNVEIPASNSCLINTNWGDKEILGYKDGKNFIEFKNRSQLLTRLRYYLENEKELKKITKNGFDLVTKNLTVDNMVNNFIENFKNIYG